MLTHFICTDGNMCKVEDCLKSCRLGKQCATKPYRKFVSREREYNGKVSSTQIGDGNRMIYLKQFNDFAVKPGWRMQSVIGSKAHASLTSVDECPGDIVEQKFEDKHFHGTLDHYSEEDKTVYDYKFVGSYKVKKCLGIVKILCDHPTEVYAKKTTRNKGKPDEIVREKGEPKIVEKWVVDPMEADMYEYEMQLNLYRILLERMGKVVDHMVLQLNPRDFSEKFARQYGIPDAPYMVEIRKIPDEEVISKYENKNKELQKFFMTGEVPPPCGVRECWEGRRCTKLSYCEVADLCNQLGDNDFLKGAVFNSEKYEFEFPSGEGFDEE